MLQKDIFFLSFKWCSQNEFISQFICLWPHLYLKIHVPCTHIKLENDDEQILTQCLITVALTQ